MQYIVCIITLSYFGVPHMYLNTDFPYGIHTAVFSERVIPSCLHQPGPEKRSSGFLSFLSFQTSVNYFGMLSMHGI